MSLAVAKEEESQIRKVSMIWPDHEITGRNSEIFLKWLARELNKGAKILRVDLGRVDYINAAGLAAMVRAGKMAPPSGARIEWHKLDDNIRMVVELTGLVNVLNLK